MQYSATGFSYSPSVSLFGSTSNPSWRSISAPSRSQLSASVSDIDDDEKERVLARVRRRRGRKAHEDDEIYEVDDDFDDDGARRSRRGDDSVSYAADMLEDEGLLYDLNDDCLDDDFDDDDESHDTFSNTLIPNQILDSIDPDGAAERFPELVSDPRFWFDLFLFIVFLDFVSFVGPRNPFLDVIPEMYNAGLPPPGM